MVHYIQMNYEGLKDDVIKMLGGGRCKVDSTGFQNNIPNIKKSEGTRHHSQSPPLTN